MSNVCFDHIFQSHYFFSVAEPSGFKPGLLPSFPFSVQIRGNLATSGRKKITLDSGQPMLNEKRIITSVWGGIKRFELFQRGEYFSHNCAFDLWVDFEFRASPSFARQWVQNNCMSLLARKLNRTWHLDEWANAWEIKVFVRESNVSWIISVKQIFWKKYIYEL